MSAPFEQEMISSSSTIQPKSKRARKAPKDQYTHVSYEKKKQKAKENRKKMATALDELETAFHQAKDGSKERSQLYQKEFSSISSSSLIDLMTEVVKDVDTTQKWDRPSYIMSAVQVIKKLNSQCQALMDELVLFKLNKSDNCDSPDQVNLCQNISTNEENPNGINIKIDFDLDQMSNVRSIKGHLLQGHELNAVLAKLDGIEDKYEMLHKLMLVNLPNSMLKHIASYLDPRSILRCGTVNKKWILNQNSVFSDDNVWHDLCLYRFGHMQVNKWLNEAYMFANGNMQKFSSMKMYQAMKSANWKPTCICEGDLYLGHAKINNVMSAWVSMVDRSNGETMRTIFAKLGATEQILMIPVVELRILIQNTGFSGDGTIIVPEQVLSISSKDVEMYEIQSDERFRKKMLNMDGSILNPTANGLYHLGLYDSLVIRFYVHAETCSSTSTFIEKANNAKLLVNLLGNTISLNIPFISTLQIEI